MWWRWLPPNVQSPEDRLVKNVLRGGMAALMLLAVSLGAVAQVEKYSKGTHYFELAERQPTQTGDQIEVLEVFSYACSHCGTLDPILENWEKNKPAEAELRLLPAVWQNPGWVEYAAAYFTAEKLGVAKQSHHPLMKLLWVDRKPPADLDAVAEFYTQFGVKADEFKTIMQSPEINAKLQEAANLARKYEVSGTPTLIVDGRWRLDMTSSGGPEQIPALIDFLVQKAVAERKAAP